MIIKSKNQRKQRFSLLLLLTCLITATTCHATSRSLKRVALHPSAMINHGHLSRSPSYAYQSISSWKKFQQFQPLTTRFVFQRTQYRAPENNHFAALLTAGLAGITLSTLYQQQKQVHATGARGNGYRPYDCRWGEHFENQAEKALTYAATFKNAYHSGKLKGQQAQMVGTSVLVALLWAQDQGGYLIKKHPRGYWCSFARSSGCITYAKNCRLNNHYYWRLEEEINAIRYLLGVPNPIGWEAQVAHFLFGGAKSSLLVVTITSTVTAIPVVGQILFMGAAAGLLVYRTGNFLAKHFECEEQLRQEEQAIQQELFVRALRADEASIKEAQAWGSWVVATILIADGVANAIQALQTTTEALEVLEVAEAVEGLEAGEAAAAAAEAMEVLEAGEAAAAVAEAMEAKAIREVAQKVAKQIAKRAVQEAGKKFTAKAFKKFTARNFRKNLAILSRHTPGKNEQAHHMLSQAYRKDFAKLGINIDDPHFGAWWKTPAHQQADVAYRAVWEQFFESWKAQAGTPTLSDVLAQAVELAEDNGLETFFHLLPKVG